MRDVVASVGIAAAVLGVFGTFGAAIAVLPSGWATWAPFNPFAGIKALFDVFVTRPILAFGPLLALLGFVLIAATGQRRSG